MADLSQIPTDQLVQMLTSHPAVQAPEQAAPFNARQPTFGDRMAASPIGRVVHDAVIAPIMGLDSMLSKLDPTAPDAGKVNDMMEKPYQASLAANRNTPGYAAARADAESQLKAKGGSGFTDQLLAPYLPAMAGTGGLALSGGNLDQSNAAADAQAAAQSGYQQKHPVLSFGGQMLGGLLAAPEGGPPQLPAPQRGEIATPHIPSIDDLKAGAKEAYRQVDNSGIQVSADAMNHMADSLQDSLGQRLDPTLHPDASAALKRVTQYATDGAKGGEAASFTDLDNLRRVVADAAKSPKPADAALAGMIKDHVDNFVDNLTPAALDTSLQDQMRTSLTSATARKGQIARQIKAIEQESPGALISKGAAGASTRETYMGLHEQLQQAEQARQAALGSFKDETALLNAGPQQTIDSLNSARNLWSRAKQSELIQGVLDDAELRASGYNQSGYENAVRSGFKNLALNKKKMAMLGPDLQDAIKAVVKGGPLSNTLRNIGRFAPHGPVAAAAGSSLGAGAGALFGGLGGAVGGGSAGAVLLPMAGEAARAASTRMTQAAAQRALETAALGAAPAAPAGAAMLNAPALTAQSRFPLGMLYPMLMQSVQRAQ